MTDLAWMKTYIGTETALTGHLTAEEFGAYERLRRHYWQHGGLPDDDGRLMRITGVDVDRWDEVRSAICSLFEDGWRLPRLDQERESAADKRVKAIEKSQRAAQARWGKNARGNAPSNACGMQQGMHEAMLEQCPSASASDEERYEEGLAPARAHAREVGTDTEQPIEPFPTTDEAEAFLRRKGVPDMEMPPLVVKLQAWRLYLSELDKFGRQAA
ncbi:uncharacterized protein YdaU (DUF1376 family) [Mesorhizobium soli]|uniref:DUF1376 domain-containing protein n=1 Tax=Pseudaminobacter soli (ex Li et al. 2025) TaxID=1295366 RepID=UPI002476A970|nr:DUF1376 domain-containing protein [Mesorhizobium soli]MDH6235158.1 uncharacterized protein YdaU (DUF1376 family) [Mesorhizobium soli]